MHIRPYTPADAPALAAIYRDAVLMLGRQQYTAAQTAAWATRADQENFVPSLREGLTLCAVIDDLPVAFGALQPIDRVAFLYCHSAHARQGHASGILRQLEAHAREAGARQLTTEASCVARPCFEANGFQVVEQERIEWFGVEFLRYRMAKQI